MIVSQIMLTGLVFQWLRSQWQDEKESLKKEITQLFRESANQVLDSLLVRDLIGPALYDSSLIKNLPVSVRKSDPATKGHSDLPDPTSYNEKDDHSSAEVTIAFSDSVKALEKRGIPFSYYDSTEKELLLRGVKLFINQAKDSIRKGNQLRHLVFSAPDTTIFKSIFEKKMGDTGHKFGIRWVSGYITDKNEGSGAKFYLESFLLSTPFGAEIEDIQRNILRGISAQILFGFVLFLVTASAFFLNYRYLKKMKNLNTLRNDFISNISHELKTPVSTVSVALDALKNYNIMNDPAKTIEYLDIASKEMGRLDNLVTQVLNTSMVEDQNQFVKFEKSDLRTITIEVLNSMQMRFTKQKAKVELQVQNEAFLLNLDKLHVQGVIFNLIDNSLKYSVDSPQIVINIEQNISCIFLKIRDNGPGIPEKYLTKVFDKFFRVPAGDNHKIKGYGLGLSFAKLVMKQHSGSIRVKNLREGGCEFTLTFPKLTK